MGSFDTFKKQSAGKKEKMLEAFKGNNKEYKKEIDTRFWKPTKGKDGTASATIRLVGLKDNDEKNFITLYNYVFKNPANNRWYWEPSLRTIGEEDPVSKYNAARWAAGFEAECKHRRVSTRNITNIYVIRDQANPENEGKVFLYEFGGQIKKLIQKSLDGTKDGEEVIEEGFDPFDWWEGANLLIKGEEGKASVENAEGNRKGLYTYENSKFLTRSALLKGDDEELKAKVFDQMHNTHEFVDPTNFKSYDDLADKLASVEGLSREELDDIINDFLDGRKKVPVKEKETRSKTKSSKADKAIEVSNTSIESDLSLHDSIETIDESELEELMNMN